MIEHFHTGVRSLEETFSVRKGIPLAYALSRYYFSDFFSFEGGMKDRVFATKTADVEELKDRV